MAGFMGAAAGFGGAGETAGAGAAPASEPAIKMAPSATMEVFIYLTCSGGL
jgi:hypothetical protein